MKNISKSPVALTKSQGALVEKLLIENETTIKYIIFKTLGDEYRYLTEECIGELCLLMCEKISELEAHPNPRAWVIVSTRLTAFTVIKKNKNHANGVPLERAKVMGTDNTYEAALYSIWVQDNTLEKLLGVLTKRETQIYYKLYVEKKSAEATARELGLTSSTVRTVKKTIKDKILQHVEKNI